MILYCNNIKLFYDASDIFPTTEDYHIRQKLYNIVNRYYVTNWCMFLLWEIQKQETQLTYPILSANAIFFQFLVPKYFYFCPFLVWKYIYICFVSNSPLLTVKWYWFWYLQVPWAGDAVYITQSVRWRHPCEYPT